MYIPPSVFKLLHVSAIELQLGYFLFYNVKIVTMGQHQTQLIKISKNVLSDVQGKIFLSNRGLP
jgi:hypothetical protein